MRTLCLSFTLGMAVAACASRPSFGPTHYSNENYPYAVKLESADVVHPIGADWRLDNYQLFQGRPYNHKRGAGYQIERSYDIDDDGNSDQTRLEPSFDLLLEHEQLDAHIWLRTVPVSSHDQKKALRVFAERYVQAASGASSVLAKFGAEKTTVSVEKRTASRILATHDCAVSGLPAYEVDFEVANVDELELSREARWTRGRLVIVRTGYVKQVGQSGYSAYSGTSYPVLMLVGGSAGPADFAEVVPGLKKLLDRIELRKDAQSPAQTGGSTCSEGASGTAGGETVEPTGEPARPEEEGPVPAAEPAASPASGAPAAP